MHEKQHFFRDSLQAIGVATELALAKQVTPLIDAQFYPMAERIAEESEFFSVIDRSVLYQDPRPDSIRHDLTALSPNPVSSEEVEATLGLVDMMIGDQVSPLVAAFQDALSDNNVLEEVQGTGNKPGKKLIVVSDHLKLPDQGFTAAFIHKAAAGMGYDRMENHQTMVVGRLIGYFLLGQDNVIDDLLRKPCGVVKTVPGHGSESLTTEEDRKLTLFREISNHRVRQAILGLIASRKGEIITMNPSGTDDKYHPDRGIVVMAEFTKGTCELLIDACKRGAIILPLFVDYGDDASIVKFLVPRTVGSVKDCHDIGSEIAAEGNRARALQALESPDIERFSVPISYGY